MTAAAAERGGGLIGLAERALRDVHVAAAVGDGDATGHLGMGRSDCGDRGESDEAGERPSIAITPPVYRSPRPPRPRSNSGIAQR